MKTLYVGIASYEDMKARTMKIVRGKHKMSPTDPTVWFTSAESFARILSQNNLALLDLIAQSEPESLAELAQAARRKSSNLSRTLRTMERYGLVSLRRSSRGTLVPRVSYKSISLVLPIGKRA